MSVVVIHRLERECPRKGKIALMNHSDSLSFKIRCKRDNWVFIPSISFPFLLTHRASVFTWSHGCLQDNIFQSPLYLGGISWLNSDSLNVSRNVWDFWEACLKGTDFSGKGLFCCLPFFLLTVWNTEGIARAQQLSRWENKCPTLVTVTYGTKRILILNFVRRLCLLWPANFQASFMGQGAIWVRWGNTQDRWEVGFSFVKWEEQKLELAWRLQA